MAEHMLMIGCGNMGQAMLARWLEMGALNDMHLTVVKPSPLPDALVNQNVSWLPSLEDLPRNVAPSVIWLAVKPQKMTEIVPLLRPYFPKDSLYCSMAAGLPFARYQHWLGDAVPIMRIMPNTPVKIGAGVVSMVANAHVRADQLSMMHHLLAPLGMVATLPDESLMDAATALAGSGTAYVYLFMEALIEAGVRHGLDASLVRDMAAHTVLGASQMALCESDISLPILRASVTSKGGTTEAALQQLEKNNALRQLMQEAISAAIARAESLK